MSVNDELARALGHIYDQDRAGQVGKVIHGATSTTVTVTITNDLHVGGATGGFTNRYDNRSDGHIANRWLIGFLKPEIKGIDLTGCILQLDKSGDRYELHEPVDEQGEAVGEIVYGAAKI